MKNIAVILAGGKGQRMGASIPKQFIEIRGKPIIIHTIENFEKNPNIDSIMVVCNPNWIDHIWELMRNFGIKKVQWVVEGGQTSHDSTRNGLFFLEDKIEADDFVIIHDAVRPILPQAIINEMLETAHREGNASVAIPCYETVIYTDDQISGIKELDRNKLMRVQTPQAYRYSLLLPLYKKAEDENRHDFVYADLVAVYYGVKIFFSRGFVNNIKVTKPEDIPFCEYLMGLNEGQIL